MGSSVTDAGEGVPRDKTDAIFDPFVKDGPDIVGGGLGIGPSWAAGLLYVDIFGGSGAQTHGRADLCCLSRRRCQGSRAATLPYHETRRYQGKLIHARRYHESQSVLVTRVSISAERRALLIP